MYWAYGNIHQHQHVLLLLAPFQLQGFHTRAAALHHLAMHPTEKIEYLMSERLRSDSQWVSHQHPELTPTGAKIGGFPPG